MQVMFLVGLTLSALTVSTSDASFAGYVANSAELSRSSLMLYLMHPAFVIHETNQPCPVITFRPIEFINKYLCWSIEFDDIVVFDDDHV